MYELNLKSGIVIKVNDNGDTITANIDDVNFVDRFYDLVNKMENIDTEINKASELSGKEQLAFTKSKIVEIMQDIDGLFGENSCKKIFGENIIPSPYLLLDFFEQLLPIFEKKANDRQKHIAEKYNNKRKGTRK